MSYKNELVSIERIINIAVNGLFLLLNLHQELPFMPGLLGQPDRSGGAIHLTFWARNWERYGDAFWDASQYGAQFRAQFHAQNVN